MENHNGLKFIENGKSLLKFCIKEQASEIIERAVLDIIEASKLITGIKAEIERVKTFDNINDAIVVATFSDGQFEAEFKDDFEFLKDTDGFAIRRKGNVIYVLADCDRGAFYGLHDLLEKNADVIWARGAKEYSLEFLPSREICLSTINYREKSPFKVRVWNTCGHGTDDVDHGDKGTAMCLGRNKIIGVYHHCDDDWYQYGVTGQSLASPEFRNIDDLLESNPEYFMTDKNGNPRPTTVMESYLNYYNPEVAKVIAKRMSDYIGKHHPEDVLCYNMPDNPYFCMVHGGVRLDKQPFTTDCGVTVYPEQKNYKSTVYFNFINRLIKELNELRPNTVIHTQAYMYSITAPAIKVDDRVMIKVAPLSANEKVAHNDPVKTDNHDTRDNILKWCKMSNGVCINAYWNCFKGAYYSRPIWKVAKENLLWWKEIGIKGFTPEGKVDCSKLKEYTEKQAYCRKFNDFNEMYTWGLHKLMWNPEQDLDALKDRYCKIVYKECADQMKEYFSLIEQGYENNDAFVWWQTGADVYIYQFIIKAGLKDKIIKVLEDALSNATTPTVISRLESIMVTLKEYIERYENFVDETADMLFCEKVNPVADEQMDFVNNKNSVWNKVKPCRIIKDPQTLKDFAKGSNVECRLLFDKENLYFGYYTSDRDIEKVVMDGNDMRVVRTDGSIASFRTETYVGGNTMNHDVFYGYVSGFSKPDIVDRFFINSGSPSSMKMPDGVHDVKKVFLSDQPEKRGLFHVQVVPISTLDVDFADLKPYGHFVVFSDKFGRGGWKGFGLWSKQNFTNFNLRFN